MDEDGVETIQSRGGRARAEKLSAEQRSEIAKVAAAARWQNAEPAPIAGVRRAVAAGELEIGEAVIPCAVLEDGTRVISARGMGKALGRRHGGKDFRTRAAEGGGQLPYFMVASVLKPFVEKDKMLVAYEPVRYSGEGSRLSGVAHGIRAELIPNFCDVWLKARDSGLLSKAQMEVAQRADILMRGLAHVGIVALVDEATGYQEFRNKTELQKILSAYISAELLPWAQKFPDDFYQEMFRLWNWQWPPKDYTKGAPKGPRYSGKLTNKLVYDQLPPGVAEALKEKAPPDSNWQRRHRLHQHLSDTIGNPHLEKQVAVALNIMKICDDKEEFQRKFEKAFPGTFSGGRQLSFAAKLDAPKSEP